MIVEFNFQTYSAPPRVFYMGHNPNYGQGAIDVKPYSFLTAEDGSSTGLEVAVPINGRRYWLYWFYLGYEQIPANHGLHNLKRLTMACENWPGVCFDEPGQLEYSTFSDDLAEHVQGMNPDQTEDTCGTGISVFKHATTGSYTQVKLVPGGPDAWAAFQTDHIDFVGDKMVAQLFHHSWIDSVVSGYTPGTVGVRIPVIRTSSMHKDTMLAHLMTYSIVEGSDEEGNRIIVGGQKFGVSTL